MSCVCVCVFSIDAAAVVVAVIRSGLNMSHANAKCRGKPSRSDKASTSRGQGAELGRRGNQGWALDIRSDIGLSFSGNGSSCQRAPAAIAHTPRGAWCARDEDVQLG